MNLCIKWIVKTSRKLVIKRIKHILNIYIYIYIYIYICKVDMQLFNSQRLKKLFRRIYSRNKCF